MNSGVYAIRNMTNGKIYIGSSVDVRRRFNDHRKGLDGGAHHNVVLLRAWKKYGAEAFVFEIIEAIEDRCELRLAEQRHIDAIPKALRYNLNPNASVPPSQSGRIVDQKERARTSAFFKQVIRTPEWCARISASSKGKPRWTAEQRLKIGDRQRGRKQSKSSNEKRAAAMRGKKMPKRGPLWRARQRDARKGKTVPLETRAKISTTLKGRVHSEEFKAKVSAGVKRAWANPEIRARQTEAIRQSMTPELRAKQRATQTGRKLSPERVESMRGRKLSAERVESMRKRRATPETKEKQRLSHLGKKHTPGQIAKISASNTGKRHTDASKARMSIAATEREAKKKRFKQLDLSW